MDNLSQEIRAKASKEKDTAVKRALHEQAETHSKQLRELKAQHAAASAESEAMMARRKSDSQQFEYRIRGCESKSASGSVPRQIFQAEPSSALAQIYGGDWEHAKDRQGRAVVNSNPAHWPVILDWLSFGTIPEVCTKELISECRYWQLERFLAAIEDPPEDDQQHCSKRPNDVYVQAEQGSWHLDIWRVVIDGNVGFTAEGHISRFAQRLAEASANDRGISLPFSAAGRDWTMKICHKEASIAMTKGSAVTRKLQRFMWGSGADAWAVAGRDKCDLKEGRGFGWSISEARLRQLMHPRMAKVDGSMLIKITLTFC